MLARQVAGAAIVLALAACSQAPVAPPDATAPSAPPAPAVNGVDALPVSTAFPVQGRDLRLVRVGAGEIALQFEFVNGTDQPVRPYDLGIGTIERKLMLADLPRATTYEVLDAQGLDGRISESSDTQLAPGESATVTAAFSAPPAATTHMLVMVNGLLPVDVPVRAAGSTALLDDPVLRPGPAGESFVGPLLCRVDGPPDASGQETVQISLPSDVLFAFGSAELSPDAQEAIAEVGIPGSGGTVTIEGHTDAVGDDASNQLLSERRAAAVRAALQAELGGSFSYDVVGFGESRPIASNTRPDGSDDPDGRARNRRVEIRTGADAPTPTPVARPVPSDLADAGLRADVVGLTRTDGYVMARVTVTNPGTTPVELGPGSGLTPTTADAEGLVLLDQPRQRRFNLCRNTTRKLGFYYLTNPSADYTPADSATVPPGAEVTFWGIYAAAPPELTSMDVELGGFGRSVPAPIGS